jgi:lipopolysaccharide export system permease protein
MKERRRLRRITAMLFGEGVILRYLAQRFVGVFLMLFIGISLVLQALNLLSESGDVLAGAEASTLSLLRYTYLNWPQLATQLPPFVTLLAALITFAALNQRSEIIVMKAAGVSPFHIVRPLVVVGGLVALAHFLFNEFVVVPTTVELRQWQAIDYAMDGRDMPPAPTDTWAMDDGTTIRVRSVTLNGTILDGVTLYRKSGEGLMNQVVNADFAAYVDGSWTLFDVNTFNIANHTMNSQSEMAWVISLPPERLLALSLQRETTSFFDLADVVRQPSR